MSHAIPEARVYRYWFPLSTSLCGKWYICIFNVIQGALTNDEMVIIVLVFYELSRYSSFLSIEILPYFPF